jgi:hypothetical protein
MIERATSQRGVDANEADAGRARRLFQQRFDARVDWRSSRDSSVAQGKHGIREILMDACVGKRIGLVVLKGL